MSIGLSFNFEKNPSCLKMSRILLKKNDTLLEFRRTWRLLTGAGVLDDVLDLGLRFLMTILVILIWFGGHTCQISAFYCEFEGIKNPPEE